MCTGQTCNIKLDKGGQAVNDECKSWYKFAMKSALKESNRIQVVSADTIVYANTYHQLHYVDVEFVKKKVQENTVNKIDKTLYLEVETATEKEE